jgi:uncharacterized membrane protein
MPGSLARMHKFLISFALVLAACSGEHDDHDEGHAEHEEHGEGGMASGATCDASLTYDNFAAAFMASYCTSCHSSALSGADRNGAPTGHDFDSLDGILLVADHIDEHAAAGPDASNELMPPTDPRPTDAEREMLGAWLACETAP